MALFDLAFAHTLQQEDATLSGIISQEPGGAKARFGVNSKAHPEALKEGFYEMEKKQALDWAEGLYKYDYWIPILGYDIGDQAIANKFFDLAVNCGLNPATQMVQRAVNSLLDVGPKMLVIDGIMGAKTVTAMNAHPAEELLGSIKEQARAFYISLVAHKPELQKYLAGWLKRADF